jgi:hypothetical protein|tara:strand:+ start:1070 stop:1243 length:174 start_codon:yes stop_codon:yes gene_type:complete
MLREEMDEQMIARLEAAYTRQTGEEAKIEFLTWFTLDGSDAIAHFDSQRGFRLGRAA